jgi:large subunit ribosomal protein L14
MMRRTVLKVIDNSGAKTAMIIGTLGNSVYRKIQVGHIVTIAVKTAEPNSSKVDRKSASKCIFSALVVATRQQKRGESYYTRFNYNAVILLCHDMRKKLLVPLATRVLAPIDDEVFRAIRHSNVPINVDAVSKVLLTAGALLKSSIKLSGDTNVE